MNSKLKKILYEHQLECLNASLEAERGIFILPTGSGKTYIQIAIALNNILEKKDNNESGIYVVNVPRILLSYQILKEFFEMTNKFEVPCDYLIVHSGTSIDEAELLKLHNENLPWKDIRVTTSTEKIKEEVEFSKKNKRPLIVIQTYHSAHLTKSVLNELNLPIDVKLNDECQYMVSEEFSNQIDDKLAIKQFHFTATAKNANVIGMNQKDKWGEKLYVMTPREAIDRGIIVPPRMIVSTSLEDFSEEDLRKSFSKIVHQDWINLKKLNNKVSNKLLIKTRGTDDMSNFIKSKEAKELMKQGVDIFVIGSNKRVDNWYNDEVYRRPEWLEKLKSCGADDSKEVICLHFDILSEGIDVPGFSSVSFFNSPELDKFIQNYGRTARLHKQDRENLKNGSITTDNRENWIKPYSYVIVHEYNDINKSQSNTIYEMIENLREYGFIPERDITIEQVRGISENEEMEDLLDDDKKKVIQGKLVDDWLIKYELESEKTASLSNDRFDTTDEVVIEYFNELFGDEK